MAQFEVSVGQFRKFIGELQVIPRSRWQTGTGGYGYNANYDSYTIP